MSDLQLWYRSAARSSWRTRPGALRDRVSGFQSCRNVFWMSVLIWGRSLTAGVRKEAVVDSHRFTHLKRQLRNWNWTLSDLVPNGHHPCSPLLCHLRCLEGGRRQGVFPRAPGWSGHSRPPSGLASVVCACPCREMEEIWGSLLLFSSELATRDLWRSCGTLSVSLAPTRDLAAKKGCCKNPLKVSSSV